MKEKSCVYEITQYDAPMDQHSWVSQFSNNLHKPVTYLYLKIKTHPAYNEETPIKCSYNKIIWKSEQHAHYVSLYYLMQHTFFSYCFGCNMKFNMESLLVDKVFFIRDKRERSQIL
jgi:hypothetical protein